MGYIAIAVLLLLTAAVPETAMAEAVYQLDFEQGEKILPDGSLQRKNKIFKFNGMGGGQPALIYNHPRFQTKVLRFQMEASSPGAIKQRSEYTVNSQVVFGKMYYVGFRFMVPIGVETPDSWNLVMQCPQHMPEGNGLSPPLSVRALGDELKVVALESYRKIKDPVNSPHWNQVGISTPMVRGKWMRGILRFRMGEHGNLKLWLNGEEKFDRDVPMGFRHGPLSLTAGDEKKQGCTFKFGVYRDATDQKYRVDFDEIRFGPTYESVTSRN